MATDFRLKDQLPKLTERIVDTYAEVGKINHLGHCPLPNYDDDHRRHRGPQGNSLSRLPPPRRPAPAATSTYHVGDLIDRLHDTLTTQIGRALRHEAGTTGQCDPRSDQRLRGPRPGQDASRSSSSCPSCGKMLATRRAGRLRRRPRLQVARRSDLLLSRPGGDHRLPAGPRAATSSTSRSSRG